LQLIDEREILTVVSPLVGYCFIRRTLLMHHSYAMLPMYSSQWTWVEV